MLSTFRLSSTASSTLFCLAPRVPKRAIPSAYGLHTSPRRYVLHLPMIIKTVMKPIAALSGRYVRRWWKALPQAKRDSFKQHFYKSRRIYVGIGGVSCGLGLTYYVSHLEVTPITSRWRFVSIDAKTLESILTAEKESLFSSVAPVILHHEHRYYRHVSKLIFQLCTRNADIEAMLRDWKLYIVPNDDLVNALCFPSGEIVVFTGLIKFVENDDQLAFILAHEIAHVLLGHGREMVSFAVILDWLLIGLAAAVWTILPFDTLALFGHWLQERLVNILLHLPYSRKLEREADEVGLEMAAKACFDVRESVKFWELMDVYEGNQGDSTPEWLSTHPASLDRAKLINAALPRMFEVRRKCGCREFHDRVSLLYPSVLFNVSHRPRQ